MAKLVNGALSQSGTESQQIESHFTQLRGEEHLHEDQVNVDEQCCQDRNRYSSNCGHAVPRSHLESIGFSAHSSAPDKVPMGSFFTRWKLHA